MNLKARNDIELRMDFHDRKIIKRLMKIERQFYKIGVLTLTYINLHLYVNKKNIIKLKGDYHQWQIAKALSTGNSNYNDVDWALTILDHFGLIQVYRDKIVVARKKFIRVQKAKVQSESKQY